jgi:hypothetical protein
MLHRTDGAACEYSDGKRSWYVNDVGYTKDEFRLLMFVTSQDAV